MRIFIITLLSFISLHGTAQKSIADFTKITYKLLNEKRYKELTEIGNQALGQGKDFYYLRQRMGLAYFNLKNYQKSIKHLQKALEFYPNDELSQELLYYSFINTNRPEEANGLAKSFSNELKKRIEPYKPRSNEFFVYGGNLNNQNITNYENRFRQANFTGSAQASGYVHFGGVGLKLSPGNRLKIHGNLSYSVSQVRVFFKMPGIGYKKEKTYPNYQLNGRIELALKKDVKFNGGAGFYLSKLPKTSTISNPSNPALVAVHDTIVDYKSVMALAGISKRWGNVELGLMGLAGYISDSLQVQSRLSLQYFPLGNLNFYGTTAVDYMYTPVNQRFIFGQKLGFKLFSKTWLDLSFTYGDLSNYLDNWGSLFFNTADRIDYIGAASLSFYLNRFIITPTYSMQSKKSKYTEFNNNISQNKEETYLSNILNLTITWKF